MSITKVAVRAVLGLFILGLPLVAAHGAPPPVSFSVSVANVPGSVPQGGIERVTATATSSRGGTGFNMQFTLLFNGATVATQNTTGVNFSPNSPVSRTFAWPVPTSAKVGAYLASVRVMKNGATLGSGSASFTVSAGGPTPGECGAANGGNFLSAPNAALCRAGTPSAVSGTGPWAWTCAGTNGGAVAQCKANRTVNGICGAANGVPASAAPKTNLCGAGTASAVTGSGPWAWACAGAGGGVTVSCSAPLLSYTVTPAGSNVTLNPASPQTVAPGKTQAFAVTANAGYTISKIISGTCLLGTWSGGTYTTGPVNQNCAVGFTANPNAVNGICGVADGIATNAPPASGLCGQGAASGVAGGGPWSWSCAGKNGGTTVACSAPLVDVPGPSARLFASPGYSCVRSFFVAPNGNDGNAGTADSPWLTIQHADDSAPQAGDCVNVEPGSYASGWTISHGGNQAAPGGYVVYRCLTLDGCTITDPSGVSIAPGGVASYVVIDGFELAAASAVVRGIGIQAGDNTQAAPGAPAGHHLWLINNVVHGFGESGIQLKDTDYVLVAHNAVYGNAGITCDLQGSGISLESAQAIPGYQPTPADKASAPFHIEVEWNIVHDNEVIQCGSAANPVDSGGNGILVDNFQNAGGGAGAYAAATLVAFNVAYGNGAAGILVSRSAGVTVANNSAFGDNLDPYDNGNFRPEIGVTGAQGNVVSNNIAYAQQGLSGILSYNAAFGGESALGITDSGNRWSNNISYSSGDPNPLGFGENAMSAPDTFPCSANKCFTVPFWQSTMAGKLDFALQANSPAIGYGMPAAYLPTLDAGACSHALAHCP